MADDTLLELVDQALALNKLIGRHGTDEMRSLMRILLTVIGQELAKQR